MASTAEGALAVDPLASTRRACAPALMAEERRFLALQERASGVEMAEAAGRGETLQLQSPPGLRIDARRPLTPPPPAAAPGFTLSFTTQIVRMIRICLTIENVSDDLIQVNPLPRAGAVAPLP